LKECPTKLLALRFVEHWEETIENVCGFTPSLRSLLYGTFTNVLSRDQKTYARLASHNVVKRYAVWHRHESPPTGFTIALSLQQKRAASIVDLDLIIFSINNKNQIFVSDSGVLGVVCNSCYLEVRDMDQVLLEADTPFILRKLANNEHYDDSLKTYFSLVLFKKEDGMPLVPETFTK
jgi:hypothetical protein